MAGVFGPGGEGIGPRPTRASGRDRSGHAGASADMRTDSGGMGRPWPDTADADGLPEHGHDVHELDDVAQSGMYSEAYRRVAEAPHEALTSGTPDMGVWERLGGSDDDRSTDGATGRRGGDQRARDGLHVRRGSGIRPHHAVDQHQGAGSDVFRCSVAAERAYEALGHAQLSARTCVLGDVG